MFITYEDLKKIEEQCIEDIRKAQARLEVVGELLMLAEEKENSAVKSDCVEEPCAEETQQDLETIA